MSETGVNSWACASCGKRYRWQAKLAGKKVRCSCGQVLQVPAEAEAPGDDAAPPARKPAPPKGTLTMLPGGASAVQRALDRREDEVTPPVVRDRYAPAVVLAIGFVFQTTLCFRWIDGAVFTVLVWLTAILLQVLVFTPAWLATLKQLATWFDLGLGDLRVLIFKTLCLMLGPAAVADVVFTTILVQSDFDWWGPLAGYAVYLVSTGILAAWFYELNLEQTATLITINFMPRVLGAYVFVLLFGERFTR